MADYLPIFRLIFDTLVLNFRGLIKFKYINSIFKNSANQNPNFY